MYLKTKLPNVLTVSVMLLLLLISACKKDDEQVNDEDESFILEESVFGCNNYQAVDLQLNDNIEYVHYYGGHYFLAAFDDRLIIKEELDGEITKEEAIEVNKFITYDSKLILCSNEGLFSVDEELNFELIFEERCLDVEINPEGNLFVLFGYSETYDDTRIYEVDLEQNTATPHTSANSVNSIYDFVFLNTSEIWARSNHFVHRFQDGELTASYNSENSPIIDQFTNKTFMMPYNGDLVFVAKNNKYQVLKFRADEWLTLKEFDLADTAIAEKDIYMGLASVSDAIIYEEKLYVATNFAGCRGIQRFEVSKNGTLEEEDYDVIQDPSLATQCIEGFFVGPDGQILFNGQQSVTSADCN